MSSYEGALSVTELSLSPLFHYQYSILTKIVSELSETAEEFRGVQGLLQHHCLSGYWDECDGSPVIFQTDTSPFGKAHSPTLQDRGYIAVPNQVIRGNKPLDIGYEVSFVNLSDRSSNWSLPLNIERVRLDETASERALSQLGQLLNDADLGFSDRFCINTLDSKYGNAAFLSDAFGHENLVNIARFRASQKVWKPDPKQDTGGAPQVYGEKYYLNSLSRWKTYSSHPQTKQPYEVYQQSIFDCPADHHCEVQATTRKGRELTVKIWRWNDFLIRSKDGKNMKDKPFDLLAIKVLDAKTQERVFEKDTFLGIHGKGKSKIKTQEGYTIYRKRYDIEPALRFGKQKLFLNKLQTPDIQHFDNFFFIYQLAVWLLFYSRDEVCFIPRKWRKYLPENKFQGTDKNKILSIAQTRHAAQALFLTFDQTPFIPIKSKKGRPRTKGQIQPKRNRYKPRKKNTRKPKKNT